MASWNSSPHPISDIRDWQRAGRLEVRPAFQRLEVWTNAAKIMLIDTILRQVPMPKMFLWNEVVDDSTHRRVIDGQQRILAILAFLDDKFSLQSPYSGEFEGLTFSQLPKHARDGVLQYRVDFNEAIGLSEAEVREVYSRVNKYTLPLNKQELRRADYPGAFLDICSELASDEYLDDAKIFSVAQRRRMGDVEFVSELVAGMLEGPQDKKGDLDYFYERYAKLNDEQSEGIRREFNSALFDVKQIFDASSPLKLSRFRQKADFYSFFLSIVELKRAGHAIADVDLDPLRVDLGILDKYIEPTSEIPILSEYAIMCVSQANSISSRSWRKNFLTTVLSGTYRKQRPTHSGHEVFEEIRSEILDLHQHHLFDDCAGCGLPFRQHSSSERTLSWPSDATVFQMSNAIWVGAECNVERK